MTEDPLIAEGAGLAAREPDRLLVGVPRSDDPSAKTPVCASEYNHLRDAGMGDTYQFAAPSEFLSYAYFSFVENNKAAAGQVVDGRGELFLAPNNLLNLRITVGTERLELPVNGVPVVAQRAPLQRSGGDWLLKGPELPVHDCVPDPLFQLVRDVLRRNLKMTAAPIWDDFRYCGYSLRIEAPVTVNDPRGTVISTVALHRVDVTAAAGFLFPYPLLAPGEDKAALHRRIRERLDANEPPDVVREFECRYLASAQAAFDYRFWRSQERKRGAV